MRHRKPDKRRIVRYSQMVGGVLIVVAGVLAFTGGRRGQVAGYFLYTIVACTFLPLPTTPYVIGLGKVFHPAVVALVGALGNCMAAYLEYRSLLWLFSKTELRRRLETSRLYQRFAWFFDRAAFACLVFTGVAAIPFEPFRLAAILVEYPLGKYLLSVLIGRIPRYYLIALIGTMYHIPNRDLALMIIVMLITPAISYVIGKYRRNGIRNE